MYSDDPKDPTEYRDRACIRCPHCGHITRDHELYREGLHETDCGDCGREFSVNHRFITYYISPKLETQ